MPICKKCGLEIKEGQEFKFHPDQFQDADTSCQGFDDEFHAECAPDNCVHCGHKLNVDTYLSGNEAPEDKEWSR